MTAGVNGMPVRGEGDGKPSRGGRIDTAGRFVLRKADQNGGGKGKVASAENRSAMKMRSSRKYSHITSTVSKFMVTGISEPRRFRSLPIVSEENVPFRKPNKKFLHVRSTIQEFMKTGLSKPRRLPKLPSLDSLKIKKFSPSNSRKFAHIASSVSKFLKTGIAEPRRYRSVPVVVEEGVHMPVINRKKRFAHVTSVVQRYVQTGILPEKRKTASVSLKEPVFENNKKIRNLSNLKPLKQQSGKAKTDAGSKRVPEQPKIQENRGIESVEKIIANLVRELRNVNAEAQPTEADVERMMGLINTKFPNFSELINSKDPFDLVFALGLGYHFKFIADFEGIGQNSKMEQ